MLKGSTNFIEEFTNKSLEDLSAWNNFKAIPKEFEKLMRFATLN